MHPPRPLPHNEQARPGSVLDQVERGVLGSRDDCGGEGLVGEVEVDVDGEGGGVAVVVLLCFDSNRGKRDLDSFLIGVV